MMEIGSVMDIVPICMCGSILNFNVTDHAFSLRSSRYLVDGSALNIAQIDPDFNIDKVLNVFRCV